MRVEVVKEWPRRETGFLLWLTAENEEESELLLNPSTFYVHSSGREPSGLVQVVVGVLKEATNAHHPF